MEDSKEICDDVVFVREEIVKTPTKQGDKITKQFFNSATKSRTKKLVDKALSLQRKRNPPVKILEDQFCPNDTADFQNGPRLRSGKSRLRLKSSASSSLKNGSLESGALNSDAKPSSSKAIKKKTDNVIKDIISTDGTVTKNALSKESTEIGGGEISTVIESVDTNQKKLDTKTCLLCGIRIVGTLYKDHRAKCLRENFAKDSGPEKVSGETSEPWRCQICNKDISNMNTQRQSRHLNKCIDKDIAKNQSEEVYRERLQVARTSVLGCPMCGRKLKTQTSRQSHLKKCAVFNNMTVDQLKNLIKQQEEEHHAKLDAGILPEDFVGLKGKEKSSNTSKPKSQLDEDTQLALALSTSLAEDRKQQEMDFIAVQEGHLGVRPLCSESEQEVVQGKGKKNKEKQADSACLLTTLPREKAMERISHRVDKYIFSKSCNDEHPSTPPFKTGKKTWTVSQPSLQELPRLWSSTSLENFGSDEPCLSQQQLEKLKFYVRELMPPLSMTRLEAGSKLKRVSAIPGRRKSGEANFIVDENIEIDTSEKDLPDSTQTGSQTVVILAELAAEGNLDSQSGNEKMDCCQSSHAHKNETGTIVPEFQGEMSADGSLEATGFYKEDPIISVELDALSLSGSYTALVDASSFSDLMITCQQGREFKAHKLILHARCPEMLALVKREGSRDVIDLSSYGEEAVLCLLQYVYGGQVSLFSSSLKEVRTLAERFSIKSLVDVVTSFQERENCNHSCDSEMESKDEAKESICGDDEDDEGGQNEAERESDFDDNDWLDVFQTQREHLKKKSVPDEGQGPSSESLFENLILTAVNTKDCKDIRNRQVEPNVRGKQQLSAATFNSNREATKGEQCMSDETRKDVVQKGHFSRESVNSHDERGDDPVKQCKNGLSRSEIKDPPEVILFAIKSVKKEEKDTACTGKEENLGLEQHIPLMINETSPLSFLHGGSNDITEEASERKETGRSSDTSFINNQTVPSVTTTPTPKKRKKVKVSTNQFKKIVSKVSKTLPVNSGGSSQASASDILTDDDINTIAIKIEQDFQTLFCDDPNDSFYLPSVLDATDIDSNEIEITHAHIEEPRKKPRRRLGTRKDELQSKSLPETVDCKPCKVQTNSSSVNSVQPQAAESLAKLSRLSKAPSPNKKALVGARQSVQTSHGPFVGIIPTPQLSPLSQMGGESELGPSSSIICRLLRESILSKTSASDRHLDSCSSSESSQLNSAKKLQQTTGFVPCGRTLPAVLKNISDNPGPVTQGKPVEIRNKSTFNDPGSSLTEGLANFSVDSVSSSLENQNLLNNANPVMCDDHFSADDLFSDEEDGENLSCPSKALQIQELQESSSTAQNKNLALSEGSNSINNQLLYSKISQGVSKISKSNTVVDPANEISSTSVETMRDKADKTKKSVGSSSECPLPFTAIKSIPAGSPVKSSCLDELNTKTKFVEILSELIIEELNSCRSSSNRPSEQENESQRTRNKSHAHIQTPKQNLMPSNVKLTSTLDFVKPGNNVSVQPYKSHDSSAETTGRKFTRLIKKSIPGPSNSSSSQIIKKNEESGNCWKSKQMEVKKSQAKMLEVNKKGNVVKQPQKVCESTPTGSAPQAPEMLVSARSTIATSGKQDLSLSQMSSNSDTDLSTFMDEMEKNLSPLKDKSKGEGLSKRKLSSPDEACISSKCGRVIHSESPGGGKTRRGLAKKNNSFLSSTQMADSETTVPRESWLSSPIAETATLRQETLEAEISQKGHSQELLLKATQQKKTIVSPEGSKEAPHQKIPALREEEGFVIDESPQENELEPGIEEIYETTEKDNNRTKEGAPAEKRNKCRKNLEFGLSKQCIENTRDRGAEANTLVVENDMNHQPTEILSSIFRKSSKDSTDVRLSGSIHISAHQRREGLLKRKLSSNDEACISSKSGRGIHSKSLPTDSPAVASFSSCCKTEQQAQLCIANPNGQSIEILSQNKKNMSVRLNLSRGEFTRSPNKQFSKEKSDSKATTPNSKKLIPSPEKAKTNEIVTATVIDQEIIYCKNLVKSKNPGHIVSSHLSESNKSHTRKKHGKANIPVSLGKTKAVPSKENKDNSPDNSVSSHSSDNYQSPDKCHTPKKLPEINFFVSPGGGKTRRGLAKKTNSFLSSTQMGDSETTVCRESWLSSPIAKTAALTTLRQEILEAENSQKLHSQELLLKATKPKKPVFSPEGSKEAPYKKIHALREEEVFVIDESPQENELEPGIEEIYETTEKDNNRTKEGTPAEKRNKCRKNLEFGLSKQCIENTRDRDAEANTLVVENDMNHQPTEILPSIFRKSSKDSTDVKLSGSVHISAHQRKSNEKTSIEVASSKNPYTSPKSHLISTNVNDAVSKNTTLPLSQTKLSDSNLPSPGNVTSKSSPSSNAISCLISVSAHGVISPKLAMKDPPAQGGSSSVDLKIAQSPVFKSSTIKLNTSFRKHNSESDICLGQSSSQSPFRSSPKSIHRDVSASQAFSSPVKLDFPTEVFSTGDRKNSKCSSHFHSPKLDRRGDGSLKQKRQISSVVDMNSPLPLRQRLGLLNPFQKKPVEQKCQTETSTNCIGVTPQFSPMENHQIDVTISEIHDDENGGFIDNGADDICVEGVLTAEQQETEASFEASQPKTPVNQTSHKQKQKKKKKWKEPSPFTPMAPYDSMDTPELKKAVSKIGVRPVGKKRMRELLKHVYHENHQYETDSDYDGTPLKSVSTAAQPSRIISDSETAHHVTKKGKKAPLSTNCEPPVKKKKMSSKNAKVSNNTEKISQGKSTEDGSETQAKLTSGVNRKNAQAKDRKGKNIDVILEPELHKQHTLGGDQCEDMPASQDSSYSDGPDLPEESILQGWPDEEIGPSQLTQSSAEAVTEKLVRFVSENRDVHESILMYEPLELDVLKKRIADAGIRVGMAKVMDFLDERCITFTMKNMSSRNNRQRRRPGLKKTTSSPSKKKIQTE